MATKPIDLEDLLRLYFHYTPVYNENHKTHLERYYFSIRRREMFKIYNGKYNVEAKLGYVNKLKTKTSYWMYVADQEIWKRAEEKADVPLHSMPDCEYMFYGMFLNCVAFMNGTKTARLVLIHSRAGDLIEFRYRPKMAETLLEHYLANFTQQQQLGLDVKEKKEQIILDL